MAPFPRPCVLALFWAIAALCPGRADAQVHRCTGPDGADVYTDRTCADIGGVEQLARSSGKALGNTRAYRGGCARNLQDLVYQMTSAIDARDANRLAGVYHWAGMSSSNGYATMARLDALVKRPLVDIVPVMPASSHGEDGDLYPQTTVRQSPVALRVIQTLTNGSTPSATVLGLQKHLGCWWVRF